MGLYERLLGSESPKIPVHEFMAALGEYERGKMTAAQITTAFGLSAGEETEAATLITKIIPPLEAISFGSMLTLTNIGTAYDGISAAFGLGFANIEYAGINAFEFRVGMNRNGAAGTVSWQVWDETTSTEVARIDDTTGTGNKFVTTTQTVPTQPSGLHVVRIRAKSTTATDDPIYYGASITIRRVNLMTADVLHHVLLLAESQMAPYTTVAAVKTRLGV